VTEEYFFALNEHIKEVQPIFDGFCALHGFAFVPRISLGRYPRIRIECKGVPNVWFDLWMEFDENGHRVERFRRDLPYELSGGAYFDEGDSSPYGVRFQKSFHSFSRKPFEQVGAVLLNEMEKHLPILETWDVPYLKTNGKKGQLGG